MHEASILYEAYRDGVLMGKYFLFIDVPTTIANDLNKGDIPVQIENLLQNAVLIQGFDKANIVGIDCVEELEDAPLDISFFNQKNDIYNLLLEAQRQLVIMAGFKISQCKASINKLSTIISSLQEVFKNE